VRSIFLSMMMCAPLYVSYIAVSMDGATVCCSVVLHSLALSVLIALLSRIFFVNCQILVF
jgi:hypothetical protein